MAPSALLAPSAANGSLKDAFLAELKTAKPTFYNLSVAQAFRIDVTASGITFAFQPNQKVAKQQCEDNRALLQTIAQKVAGRPVPVTVVIADAGMTAAPAKSAPRASSEDVKQDALANATVQAVLEIFPIEKTTVEEI